jgi:hypothetical protein
LDEDQASAGAQLDPTALLHPWKTAVTLRYRLPCAWELPASGRRMENALVVSSGGAGRA